VTVEAKTCSLSRKNNHILRASFAQAFALAKCQNKEGRGGARAPIPVASAEEIVQLLHALPGDTESRYCTMSP